MINLLKRMHSMQKVNIPNNFVKLNRSEYPLIMIFISKSKSIQYLERVNYHFEMIKFRKFQQFTVSTKVTFICWKSIIFIWQKIWLSFRKLTEGEKSLVIISKWQSYPHFEEKVNPSFRNDRANHFETTVSPLIYLK